MGKEQLLSQLLVWKREALPDNFAFIMCNYVVTKEVDYDSEALRQFLDNAMDWQFETANSFFAYLGAKEK